MRALALAVVVLTGCSAVDDFGVFQFADGGSSDDGSTGAAFGAACMPNGCMQYNSQRPVMCEQTLSGGGSSITFPSGMCTRTCMPGVAACSDYGVGVADCEQIGNVNFCLPHCNTSLGQSCRAGYNCCNGNNKTNGPGACTPMSFCN